MGAEKFKWQRMATRAVISLEHLLRYEREGDEFLDQTVKGDQSWCLHYDKERKCMSQQWKYPSCPWPKKSHTITSAGNLMLTLCFDCCGPLLIDWLPQGTTVNDDHYGETMELLRSAIKAETWHVIMWHQWQCQTPICQKRLWEAATFSVGSSSRSPIQSRPNPLWLSCVRTNEKGT